MPDPYVLSGTAILRNRFNLTTQQDLDEAEADFAALTGAGEEFHQRGLWCEALLAVPQIQISEFPRYYEFST